eukprot:scaffold176478_cov27-Tisochrysis_lutea.AAC.1
MTMIRPTSALLASEAPPRLASERISRAHSTAKRASSAGLNALSEGSSVGTAASISMPREPERAAERIALRASADSSRRSRGMSTGSATARGVHVRRHSRPPPTTAVTRNACVGSEAAASSASRRPTIPQLLSERALIYTYKLQT